MSLPEEELRRLADSAISATSASDVSDVFSRLNNLAQEDVVRLIPRLWATGGTGDKVEAFRDGAKADLAARLTGRMLSAASRLEQATEDLRSYLADAITHFDKSSTRLAWAMIVIAVVMGVVQILVAVLALSKH